MMLAYGVAQPFLPATLVDVTAAAIWRGINIWRSLGWTVLLALLLYAPLLAWRRRGDQRLAQRADHRGLDRHPGSFIPQRR